MPETPEKPNPGTPPRPAPRPARPAPRPKPSPLAVITAALGLFFVVLTLMAVQVRNGRDPALGPGPVVPVAAKQAGKNSSKPAATQTQTQQATKVVTQTSPTVP